VSKSLFLFPEAYKIKFCKAKGNKKRKKAIAFTFVFPALDVKRFCTSCFTIYEAYKIKFCKAKGNKKRKKAIAFTFVFPAKDVKKF